MRNQQSRKLNPKGQMKIAEEEVDFAAAADFHAKNVNDREDDELELDASAVMECESDDDDAQDVENDGDGDEGEDEETEDETDGDELEEDVSDDDEDSIAENDVKTNIQLSQSTISNRQFAEPCSFDLRNLLAVNSHQLNSDVLYKKIMQRDNTVSTISRTNITHQPDENFLLEKSMDGCSQLVHALWQLPVERSDAGPLVILPLTDESRIPRSLPPPELKKETKWEKFAREKGIANNKEKRSQKVWDEATGTWLFRHGYQKANDKSKEWPIMEVKDTDNPYDDPWERIRDEKNARVGKNREQRMKNEERSGNLPKGSTNRLLKNAEHRRNAGKAGGLIDRHDVPPSGLPIDLPKRGVKKQGETSTSTSLMRGKESTVKALLATQRSTASLGKFDKMREGEPQRKKADNKALTKRKAPSGSTDPTYLSTEKERSMKMLKTVTEGGIQKEKDRKKGRLANGDSAYEYDFDDGLGPSSFRKKKGRAGAGKMKKMTKKRVK